MRELLCARARARDGSAENIKIWWILRKLYEQLYISFLSVRITEIFSTCFFYECFSKLRFSNQSLSNSRERLVLHNLPVQSNRSDGDKCTRLALKFHRKAVCIPFAYFAMRCVARNSHAYMVPHITQIRVRTNAYAHIIYVCQHALFGSLGYLVLYEAH